MSFALSIPPLATWTCARDARSELIESLRRFDIAFVFGWQDIAQRYRRSKIGAFWLTINMTVLVAALGLIFGTLFDAPMSEFLPYVASGLLIWGFLATTLSEGCTGFIQAEQMILHARLPLPLHIFRIWWRNSIIFAHNLVIIPGVFLFFGRAWGAELLLFPLAYLLVSFTIIPASLILAIFCTRYRDMPQVIQNILQVLFYATPLIWMPSTLPDRVGTTFLNYNPFYHLLTVMRAPLIGELPPAASWGVTAALAVFSWTVALVFFGRYRHRIAYWL